MPAIPENPRVRARSVARSRVALQGTIAERGDKREKHAAANHGARNFHSVGPFERRISFEQLEGSNREVPGNDATGPDPRGADRRDIAAARFEKLGSAIVPPAKDRADR